MARLALRRWTLSLGGVVAPPSIMLLVAGGVLLSTPGMAQVAPQARSAREVARCALAAQNVRLRSGRLAATARGALPGCDEETAQALPARWRDVGSDVSDLNTLITLSVRVRDRRLFSEVAELAQSPDKPFLVRGAAIIVLASYYNPMFVGSVFTTRGQPQMGIGERLHISQVDGPQKLGPGADAAVERILRQIAADTTSPYHKWANYVFVMSKGACAYPTLRKNMRTCPDS